MTNGVIPLRIKRVSLIDFRAFPGPGAVNFDLDGKSLLVYGENGAGKSSIFHGFMGFFSQKGGASLRALRNVFSGAPEANCSIAVEFNDGAPGANWRFQMAPATPGGPNILREIHPARTSGAIDPRVTQTALRRACLDYRALLDTNYRHGNDHINLFDIAVGTLLADYPVTVSGGTTRTIGELWESVEKAKPAKHTPAYLARVNQACADFNLGFNSALTALHPYVDTLLGQLTGADVTVAQFAFAGVTYDAAYFKRDRKVSGRNLNLNVRFRNHVVAKPQQFLNEARLSALALAIYLAGRLACTPTATPNALRLMVLDDVLIGLDHSNRLPVLKVLRQYFSDWQIVLLTHDRVWFEMARFLLGVGEDWKFIEVFEAMDVARGIPAPMVRRTGEKAANVMLAQARIFLIDHHVPAAANYTRAAFELVLKSFCERFGVPVAFKSDPRHLDTEHLISAVEVWFKAHASRACFVGLIDCVKLFRKVVLNPYSHSSPPTIASAEVAGAIEAVGGLAGALDRGGIDGDPLIAARQLIAGAQPSSADLHAALGFLRVTFLAGLKRFCVRHHVLFAYEEMPKGADALWHTVFSERGVLFPGVHAGLPPLIEAEKVWLAGKIDETNLAVLTLADLTRLVQLLTPAGARPMVLDEI